MFSLPLPEAEDSQSLRKSQMAISLSLLWAHRKTGRGCCLLSLQWQRAGTVKRTGESKKGENWFWPTLWVLSRNHLHLLDWAKSDGKQLRSFSFLLHVDTSKHAPGIQPDVFQHIFAVAFGVTTLRHVIQVPWLYIVIFYLLRYCFLWSAP